MSFPKLRRLPLALAAMAACMSAQAGYQSPDGKFSLSGFGTLGAVQTDTDDAVFNYPGQRDGATKTASFSPDSKVAIQGSYKFTPTISFTTQLLAKNDAEGQIVPNVQWAFGKWQATSALSFRAGRIGAPFFMISDFRDVGYANTTARPPLDVYGQVPFSQFEGADGSYQLQLGSATTLTSTLWAGRAHSKYTSSLANEASDLTLNNALGLNLQAEMDNGLSFRVGHLQGKLSVSSQPGSLLRAGASSATLRGGLATAAGMSIPGAAAALASLDQVDDAANPQGADTSFTGIGMAYDGGKWIGSMEYTKRKSKSFISDTTGWYGVLGYRINKFTPYAGLSQVKTDRRSANPVVTTNLKAFNPAFAAADAGMAGLSGGMNALFSTQNLDQKTSTLGMRWDATSSMAVKVQWDHVRKPANSNGMFQLENLQSATAAAYQAEKRNINVLTLSVDFVF